MAAKPAVYPGYQNARNVIGYVAGTSLPDDVFVVSAHFDHLGVIGGKVYPGADDNASGTAALLAIAAYVKAHPPLHTVVFAAFDAEELGLRGSREFVDHLPFPRERLRLDINIDEIGRADDGRLFAAGVEHTPALRSIVEAAARTSTVPVHLGHDRSQWLTGLIADWTDASDHGSFHDVGIPFLYFGVEDHDRRSRTERRGRSHRSGILCGLGRDSAVRPHRAPIRGWPPRASPLLLRLCLPSEGFTPVPNPPRHSRPVL